MLIETVIKLEAYFPAFPCTFPPPHRLSLLL